MAADKNCDVGIGPEVRKLRLGESFSKNGNTAFHTFRYDFKPASMDSKKMASVQIGSNNQMTVQVPNVEGSGTSHTIYKGPRKPYTKECVLIIDRSTGEITLEKLSCNVQLKKTRAEGSSRAQLRPITPVEQSGSAGAGGSSAGSTSKKTSPPQKHSPNLRPPHSPVQRTSPNQTSPYRNKSPTSSLSSHFVPATNSQQRSPSMPNLIPPSGMSSSSKTTSFVNSMPLLTSGSSTNVDAVPPLAVGTSLETVDESSQVGILSDSSNESSSSSGSESSDSESEMVEVKKPSVGPENASSNSSQYASSSFPSMPCFSQLSDDLHLSESDSDG